MSGGNHHRTQLVQSDNGIPELITTFQYQHHHITATDTQTLEIRRRHIGIFLQVGISILSGFPFIISPQQRFLVGFLGSPRIYYIITEIKIFGYLNLQVLYKILL